MKKFLSAFAAAAVVLSMVGCSGGTEQVSDTAVETVQSEALTFDDINIIEINGKTVSLPFKVEELGEEYSIVEEQGNVQTYPAIYYNEQCLAFVDFDANDNVISISFPSDSLKREDIKLYGLSSNDTYDKIISVIGTPTTESETLLIYEYEQGGLYFSIDFETLKINIIKISLGKATD